VLAELTGKLRADNFHSFGFCGTTVDQLLLGYIGYT